MPSVAVNPPKTPVTKGSMGVAAATLPNMCKMPGPPAPFVPAPLPNIGKSGDSPKDYSTTVKVEGNAVAIKGASFGSMGDMASKALGGGLVSMNTHGPTKFIAPGSMDVKFQGKNVQLLGDQMMNNCGPSGSPANSATMMGTVQGPNVIVPWEDVLKEIACKCDKSVKANKQSTCRELGNQKHDCCNKEIQKQKNKSGPGRKEQLAPERGYTNPHSPPSSQINGTRNASFRTHPRSCWPDAVLLDPMGKPKQLFDFKFKCPAGTRTKKRKKDGVWETCDGNQPTPDFSPAKKGKPSQLDTYLALGDSLGIDNAKNPPKVVNNEGC